MLSHKILGHITDIAMATERIIILAIIIASLISVASAVAGTATYYTKYLRKFALNVFFKIFNFGHLTYLYISCF